MTGGICYELNKSDPNRDWVITRKAPIARLLVEGRIWGFTRSVPPPRRMVGRRISIHAGSQTVKIRPLSGLPAAQEMIARAALQPDEHWRAALSTIHDADQRCVMGSAVLSAAFELGRVLTSEGGVAGVYSYKPDSRGRRYLGDWRAFDASRIVPIGNWDGSTPSATRWVWCFRDPVKADAIGRDRLKGFGGLWDLERAKSYRAAEVAA